MLHFTRFLKFPWSTLPFKRVYHCFTNDICPARNGEISQFAGFSEGKTEFVALKMLCRTSTIQTEIHRCRPQNLRSSQQKISRIQPKTSSSSCFQFWVKQPTVFPPLSGGIQIPPLLGNLSRPRSFRNWIGMIGCSNLYCKNLQVFLACVCGAKNVNTDNNDNILEWEYIMTTMSFTR